MFAIVVVLAVACGACSDRDQSRPPQTLRPNSTNAAPTYTATATPNVLALKSDPVVKTFPRGGTVDVARGTLFLDPKTGGGEAWADVRVSPSGMFAPWNGADGKQPPVLYQTATKRRIELETGGRFGTVLDFAPDESEVSVRVGDQVRIASTTDGKVRVTLPVAADATFTRAFWGANGAVAVTAGGPQGRDSLGVSVWWRGQLRGFAGVPAINWFDWSPDGTRFVVSTIGDSGWTAIVDVETGSVTRIDQALYNPRWSAGGSYFAGQLLSGELQVFRVDGKLHMRMNGVCAFIGSPWMADEIVTFGFGTDVAVAMNGTVRAYTPLANKGRVTTFGPNNGVVLLDRVGGSPLAELMVAAPIPVSGYLNEPWVTPDGRGKFQLGVGGKGTCENVGAFKVEVAPFD